MFRVADRINKSLMAVGCGVRANRCPHDSILFSTAYTENNIMCIEILSHHFTCTKALSFLNMAKEALKILHVLYIQMCHEIARFYLNHWPINKYVNYSFLTKSFRWQSPYIFCTHFSFIFCHHI